ncbi:hypothetical protein AAG570_006111 [Ranatra chinensis]|uniref:Uncharacterized protein n=1 Tax=Ranatra chinensis TaxID=642074 RepID=A0ABD0XX22_9HEMI
MPIGRNRFRPTKSEQEATNHAVGIRLEMLHLPDMVEYSVDVPGQRPFQDFKVVSMCVVCPCPDLVRNYQNEHTRIEFTFPVRIGKEENFECCKKNSAKPKERRIFMTGGVSSHEAFDTMATTTLHSLTLHQRGTSFGASGTIHRTWS